MVPTTTRMMQQQQLVIIETTDEIPAEEFALPAAIKTLSEADAKKDADSDTAEEGDDKPGS